MLKVENLHASVGDKEILKGINLTVKAGTRVMARNACQGIDSLKSIEAYSAAIENRGESKIYDKQGSSEALRLLNVSKCEHERWNSATRLMGFVNGAEKVFIKHMNFQPILLEI